MSNPFVPFIFIQAADAALPTLDEFVAGMHWATTYSKNL